MLQTYSRLVIDCNRDPDGAEFDPGGERDDGDSGQSSDCRPSSVRRGGRRSSSRITRASEALLDARQAAGRRTVFVAMHSFTPVFKGESRAMQVGVLYNRDARLAEIMLELLRAEGDLTVGDNAPYAVSDVTDYGVPVHAERRGLAHVEIEIRQDLIADEAGQAAWAARFERLLRAAAGRLSC